MCHVPTLELFQTCFPPGVVNVLHGSGRETLPVLLEEGSLDIFAFIGTSKAAVDLQRLHPHPNRLRVCLGLDAKNPAIVCADADVTVAVNECVLGSLSFNGQRCTALKVIYVHESVRESLSARARDRGREREKSTGCGLGHVAVHVLCASLYACTYA
jgi:glyceraldehyde-3-phosphate dehydrogenase (NADP+)